MAKLKAREESFIKFMTESEELARRGFNLLLETRTDYDQFFDALSEAGLFEPSHNPAPAPAEEKGSFYIPYWSALGYLKAVAKLSGDRNDTTLANKVLGVVRSVSGWRDPKGLSRENYHTSREFAEILGLVPTGSVTLQDVDLARTWLSDKFERGMVTQALDKGAVPKFLASSVPEDWEKAAELLRHCVTDHRPSKEPGESAAGALEGFWLKELLGHHSATFGAKIGKKAADILLTRVREIYSSEGHRLSSGTYRPAIEDHPQNYRWREDENWSVEGLRDVVLSWCEADPDSARKFVTDLLTADTEILRRVGIFVLGKQWKQMQELYSAFVGPQLFSSGHLHELYNLLQEHFADLAEEEKAASLEAIRQIPIPKGSKDPARSLKRIQQRWLLAIAGKSYQPAEEWFAELQADPSLGRLSDHPDFESYMESWVGPGPTPYSVQELVAFAEAGAIVEKLNSFEPKDDWRGPTMEGLVSALNEAVRTAPEPFLQLLPEFLKAERRFQHCVIWGLKQAWEAKDGKQAEVDWEVGWQKLVTFFEHLIGKPEFWDERVSEGTAFVGNRDWVVSAVSEFLDVGTRNDERAYSGGLLPHTWPLIEILLKNASSVVQPPDDAMTEAINSPKGKAVEVLFSQALRVCRASDKEGGSHAEAWTAIRPLFDGELEKCKNANYEFSTLAGAYLPQLDYMDREWLKTKVDLIFPPECPANSTCAIDGLAYAQFTRPVYTLLAGRGVLDRALTYDLKGRNAREKLLERIAAGYLWGEEALESSRFSYLFKSELPGDLEIVARVFWSVRGGQLSTTQENLVREYWERCLAWSRGLAKPPVKLLSTLSMLSSYLTTADGKEREMLEAVAPYVHHGYNASSFFGELLRLVEVSPEGVTAVLGKVIEAHVPYFDFEDRLKSLLFRLAEKGKKQDVILYAERLRSLGMQDLFDHLTRN
jgi:hypothetical protein